MNSSLVRRMLAIAFVCLLVPACQMVDTGVVATRGASHDGIAHLRDIRSGNGLGAMRADSALERAARRQAGYMASAGRMAHDTGRGRDFASRMRRDDIRPAAAENIAHGRMSVPELFSMWMDSAGHRRNMLDPRFDRFGLAHAEGADGARYWALVMAP